jgi:hypothetical protein
MMQVPFFLTTPFLARPLPTDSSAASVLGQQPHVSLRLSGENPVLPQEPPGSFSFSQSRAPQTVAPLASNGTNQKPSLRAAEAQYALQLATRKIMEALSPLFGPEWVVNLKLKATKQTPSGAISLQSSAASSKATIRQNPQLPDEPSPPQSALESASPDALGRGSSYELDDEAFDDSTEATLAQVAQLLQQPFNTAPSLPQVSFSLAPASSFLTEA